MVVPTKVSSRKHSRQQGAVLEKWLVAAHNMYPTKEEKIQLANSTEMSYHQVNRWFANKRRKLKVSSSTSPVSDRVFSPAETEPAYSPSPQISPADDCDMKNCEVFKCYAVAGDSLSQYGDRPCPVDLSKRTKQPDSGHSHSGIIGTTASPVSKLAGELEMFLRMCTKDNIDVVRNLLQGHPLAAFDSELLQRQQQAKDTTPTVDPRAIFYGYPGFPPVSSPYSLSPALFPQAAMPNSTVTGFPFYGYQDFCNPHLDAIPPPLLSSDMKAALNEYLNVTSTNPSSGMRFDPSLLYDPCGSPLSNGDLKQVAANNDGDSPESDTDILVKETIAISVLASFALQKKTSFEGQDCV